MSSRYEIREQIGKGGLGAVYKAFDTQLQREVAIKRVLTAGQAMDEEVKEAAEKLISEAQTLSSLNHPNIITVFDVGQDEQGGFVVMELLKGETLDETIERGVLNEEDFTEVVFQTMEALISAQANNVIHRDIKPTNIMVIWQASGKFQTKILDFGLAKFSKTPSIQTMNQDESVLGSIFFMAPEQFERSALDARTDLYQMGCVYYNALTGQYPFNGETAPQVMNSHLQHKVVPLDQIRPDLAPSICQWVMWLINQNVEHRPSNAKDALQRWPRNLEAVDTVPVKVVSLDDGIDVTKGQIKIVTGARQASAPHTLIVGTAPNPPAAASSKTLARPAHHRPKPSSKNKTRGVVIGSIAGGIAILAGIGIISIIDESKQEARISEMATLGEVFGTAKDVEAAVDILSDSDAPLGLRTNALKVLHLLEGAGVNEAIFIKLQEANSNSLRVHLSSVLADKGYSSALPTILRYVLSANKEEQQLQFIAATSKLAEDKNLPEVLKLLENNRETQVRRAIERLALNLLRHSKKQKGYIGDILTRLSSAESDERKSLFRILGALGSDEVKTRLSSIFNQKKDLDYQRDAISAYLTWSNRSPIPQVEAIIDNTDDRSLQVIAGRALARLVTLPGPENLEEKIATWDSAARRISDQNSLRRLVSNLLEYPHPETLRLLRSWNNDEDLKSVTRGAVATMETSVNSVKTIATGEELAGNLGSFQGDQKAAINSSLGSITEWTSRDTWFSWSFKIQESGDYTFEVKQSSLEKESSDFIIYVADQILEGRSAETGDLSLFSHIKLDGAVTLKKDEIYTLVLAAGEKTMPRMMDIGGIQLSRN